MERLTVGDGLFAVLGVAAVRKESIDECQWEDISRDALGGGGGDLLMEVHAIGRVVGSELDGGMEWIDVVDEFI